MPRLACRTLWLATLATPALAQRRRPLRVVIPFPPGGGVDSLGRLLADRLAPLLGQPAEVENRSGGGGLIGPAPSAWRMPGPGR